MRLTQKQEQFTFNLFKNMTQRQAWVEAGYSSKYSVALIDSHACVLANRDKIKKRLEEFRAEARLKEVADFQERQKILSEIARANIPDYITEDGIKIDKQSRNLSAVAEIETRSRMGKQGAFSITKFKLHNPVPAIDLLNKMDGNYSEDSKGDTNIQINIYTNIPRPEYLEISEELNSNCDIPESG